MASVKPYLQTNSSSALPLSGFQKGPEFRAHKSGALGLQGSIAPTLRLRAPLSGGLKTNKYQKDASAILEN